MKQCLFRIYSLALGVLAAGVAFAGSVAPAQAALLSTSACDTSTLTQPFLHWGDANEYKLVPGGTFESGTPSWTLTGGATLTTGSEPYGATGSVGSRSLYLPAGGSAQSPYTCVNAAYPLLRLFARNRSLLSTVLVQLVYLNPLLGPTDIPVGVVALSGTWQPTLPMLTLSAVPGALNGGTAQVAVRFTAVLGASQIDDVFVDPRMSG
ncbi:MAG TPA: hypothetical protein VKT31_10215 [Solirubrobacteraceae bacterium]|nr:hypothetical protein [Solirubrobacteraceae bacterium]